jgi:Sensors of blue-light using FAD
MNHTDEAETPLHVLYTSQLCPDQSYAVFTAVSGLSRSRNLLLGIRSVLVFDGMRFCQLLVGPPRRLLLLVSQIFRDKRHETISLLAQEVRSSDVLESHWLCGFCEPKELDLLQTLRGHQALEAFDALLNRADLST